MFGSGETTAAYVFAVTMLAVCGLVFLSIAKILDHVVKKGL
jgi:hypothetical protein